LFTKALGTGVISTAIKKEKAEPAWIEAAVQSMTTLNKRAAEVITGVATTTGQVGTAALGRPVERSSTPNDAGDQRPTTNDCFQVHALTDITGFGLVGHARELALASDVSLTLRASRIPVLEGALECVHAGHIPGGLKNNRDFAECLVEYDDAVPDDIRTLLFDPQTAGGLLISVAAPDSARLTQALREAAVPVVEIGEVSARTKPRIRVKSA